MATRQAIDLSTLHGYTWMDNGQSVLSGKVLDLYQKLDRMFLTWASVWNAERHQFPTFLPAAELAKLDYFHSFPHLVTFPVVLDADDGNLKQFSGGEPIDGNGEIHLTRSAPIRDVLTPAACYHFYVNLQGTKLEDPKVLTTCATCFRRETHYLPLERQWSFSMREIVCIGTAEEVKAYLAKSQEFLTEFFKDIDLPIEFQNATDPFFNPSKNPKYLMQKLDPVKTEMVYGGKLAIGSLNFHRNYFGEAFQISRDGKEAFSGCVAFGLERWIYALVHTFGTDLDKIKLPVD